MNSKIVTYFLFGIMIASFAAITLLGYPWYYVILADVLILALTVLIFRTEIIALYANLSYVSGKHELARIYLEKAINKKTKNSAAYLNYAIMLVREGKAKESIEYLKMGEAINKNVINAKNISLTMASSYWVLGEIDKAIEILEDMCQKYEYVNSHVLTTLGYMYLLKGDFEKALLYTNKALEDSPESGAAWDNLGQIFYTQENFEEAKTAFEKALSYKNGLVDSLFYLGKIALQEENIETAKEYFIKASNCDISSLNTVSKEQIEKELSDLALIK